MRSTKPFAARRFFPLLSVVLLAAAVPAVGAGPGDLDKLRDAMRAADFDAALRLADACIAPGAAAADEAMYLKALALFHSGKMPEAAGSAQTLIADHAASPWLRKARFLQAQALIGQRQYAQAEAIYEEEAFRLLSAERKEGIAAVLVKLAGELSAEPDPSDVGAVPPDYAKAQALYAQVLAMEIGRDLRDRVLYERASTFQDAGDHGQAIAQYHAYLEAFDPDWTGPAGSASRLRGRKRENPPPPGQHVLDARYHLGKSLLESGQLHAARTEFEDLITLALAQAAKKPRDGESDLARLRANATWQIVRTFNMPAVPPDSLEAAIKAARDFLAAHTAHRHAVEAAWLIAQAYHAHGRLDDAVSAYEAFIAGRDYRLPEGPEADEIIERLGKSARQAEPEWKALAHYHAGQIRFDQRQYARAIEWFERYVSQFPSGPHWSAAQHQIVNARYQVALDAVAEQRYADGRRLLEEFLSRHPLDGRAAQALFVLGQMHVAEKDYAAAIREWARLIGKYPGTEEASLGLYRTGVLYEEKLGQHEEALDAYRRLTFGSWFPHAQQRIALMTQKHLTLATERTFRTSEKAAVKINVRNIETLTVRQYVLDPEAYFRKTHTLGGVEALDIALIEPDRTWEVPIDGYRRYAPIEQSIEIPFEEGRPGVCLVNIAEDDLEATTLVVRSDLDLLMRASRREALVYVQDMRRQQPAAGADVIVSDGTRVLASEKTGEDGVFRRVFGELASLADVRVFAVRDGHVASSTLGLGGLALSQGLARKAYVYSDRPAYRPGQTVRARGIVRGVKDGTYETPAGRAFVGAVIDSAGRVLVEEDVVLSRFGTFSLELPLGDTAPLGEYRITVRPKDEPVVWASGGFQVQEFQIPKMTLAIEFERRVYYRGETVRGTIVAAYAWGGPVPEARLAYMLPDGRTLEEQAGPDGRLAIEFDTSGVSAEALWFTAAIRGEVEAAEQVYLPARGFDIALEPSREIALAGEPFDVAVKTTAPGGEPLGADLTLFVLRRVAPPVDPVLSDVPWLERPARPAAEVTVQERPVRTDPRSGAGTVRLELKEGGQYVLRVAGKDRFGQMVTAERTLEVAGEGDSVPLRILADGDTLEVGEKATVKLHSRLDKCLALLTWEGESIIAHRVVELGRGDTPLTTAVGHEHFPNFALSVTVMHGRDLVTTSKPFKVERELRVTVRPLAETYAPGSTGQIELTATDQLGKPVEAELSLALVEETLYAVFPDLTPDIQEFFQAGARRHADFRVIATNAFSYSAQTRSVVKAIQDEAERLVLAEQEAQRLLDVREELKDMAVAGRIAVQGAPEPSDSNGLAAGEKVQWRAKAPSAPSPDAFTNNTGGITWGFESRPFPAAPRRDTLDAGWWSSSIVTGSDGKATVSVPMPEKTSAWRLTARGVSADALVGQATAKVITRQDFFVEIKAPPAALEGDSIRLLARLHNMTDYAGQVELALTVTSGTRRLADLRQSVRVKKSEGAEVLFDAFDVPAAGQIEVTVTAKAGPHTDALTRAVPVRPWGLDYAAHGGGSSSTSAGLALELPKGLPYSSRWLSIAVGPSIEHAVIDMALRPQHARAFGGSSGGELLAAVSGLEYARTVKADAAEIKRLADRARGLVAALVVAQHQSGGWAWRPGGQPDWPASAVSCWALARARQAGLTVHAETLAKAQQFLRQTHQQLSSGDHEAKAVVLHALAESGAGDFELVNSVYRHRNELGPGGLAYTALTLARLDRREMAGELLDLLEAKVAAREADGQRRLASWSVDAARHPWMGSDADVTAIALLALIEVRPQSPRVAEAVAFLLDRRGCFGFDDGRLHGAAVAALAAHFGRGQYTGDDYKLTVLVNDTPVRTIERRAGAEPVTFDVAPDLVRDGRNRVRFELEGRGQFAYAATLRGFSSEMRDPKSWDYPYVSSRRFFHAPLTYRGLPINATSTSPVRQVEIGQRVEVRVDLHESGRQDYLVVEESIPAGMTLVPGSLRTQAMHQEIRDGRITLFYGRGESARDFTYELAGFASGTYRALPTVIRDAVNPARMRVGQPADLIVLAPGQESDDPYQMNDAERYALGTAHFEDGHYADAIGYLWPLFNREQKYQEREVARMLLWIHTDKAHFDAARVVDCFEVLSERHPQLTIPFDKILVVGQAYRYIGEMERAWLVYRATIDSSFLSDSAVSAILQDHGQLLGSIDFQEALWWQYPDTAEVASSWFALSQLLYENAARGPQLAGERTLAIEVPGREGRPRLEKPTRADMLAAAVRLMASYQSRYPVSTLADDVAFSLTSAFLDLKDYDAVVRLSDAYRQRFAGSEFASSFRYMTALGHFWKRDYENALAAASEVAGGETRDRDLARYILGQIYHAQGRAPQAIDWYEKVASLYPDASQAIDYFRQKHVSLEEVNLFKPGEPVHLTLKHRNVGEAHVQVYRVDLMKLYLREKNLSGITKVNLAGIEPELSTALPLGDGKDYVDRETAVALDLKDEGAYLVICRGDDLFASGLVLVTPLRLEVQEDAVSGRVRVNVIDEVSGLRPAEVHVKAIGTQNPAFTGGDTDLRGIFVADGLMGTATVIARAEGARYAFYRGETWLGPPPAAGRRAIQGSDADMLGQPVDYQGNLRDQNDMLQQQYNQSWDALRRSGQKGVQVDKAR